MKNCVLILVCITMCMSCSSLHLGGGISYDHGNSSACQEDSGLGIHLASEYYFAKREEVGIALEAGPLGYTDCGDGDPLIHISPLIKYRYVLSDYFSLIPYVGYTFGPFVDEGVRGGVGLRMYPNHHIFFDSTLDYYRAFSKRQNTIALGRSENIGLRFRVGYMF